VASTQALEDHVRQGRFEDSVGWLHDRPAPLETAADVAAAAAIPAS